MKQCQACGMPLMKKEDFSQGDETSNFCLYCTNEDGSVKTCEEVFNGGVAYFKEVLDNDEELAKRVVRKNMSTLEYWKDKDNACLNGDMITDQEFAELMEKLSKEDGDCCCGEDCDCGDDCECCKDGKCDEDCKCHEAGCKCCETDK